MWVLAEKGQDSKRVEEKQLPIRTNQDFLEEIGRLAVEEDQLKKEMQDAKGQNELLGCPLLELEGRGPVCCKLSNGALSSAPNRNSGKVSDAFKHV